MAHAVGTIPRIALFPDRRVGGRLPADWDDAGVMQRPGPVRRAVAACAGDAAAHSPFGPAPLARAERGLRAQGHRLRIFDCYRPMRAVRHSVRWAAETINGLYKAEVIHRRSWRSRQDVELATLDWVDWYDHRRLLGSIGNIPPAEAEAAYYRQQAGHAEAAGLKPNSLRDSRGVQHAR